MFKFRPYFNDSLLSLYMAITNNGDEISSVLLFSLYSSKKSRPIPIRMRKARINNWLWIFLIFASICQKSHVHISLEQSTEEQKTNE